MTKQALTLEAFLDTQLEDFAPGEALEYLEDCDYHQGIKTIGDGCATVILIRDGVVVGAAEGEFADNRSHDVECDYKITYGPNKGQKFSFAENAGGDADVDEVYGQCYAALDRALAG